MTATIEEVKKFWDDRPCNVRHSDKEVGTFDYFKEVTKKKFFVEPHIKTFSDFGRWNGKKVLEIGCGMATAGVNFAANGAYYTGVELSETSLDLAKRRFELFGQSGDFYHGNAELLSTFVPPTVQPIPFTSPRCRAASFLGSGLRVCRRTRSGRRRWVFPSESHRPEAG